jgi:hypothetical protein
LLAKYWESVGQRLAAGPESLERVPENLARVAGEWLKQKKADRSLVKVASDPFTGAQVSEEREQYVAPKTN